MPQFLSDILAKAGLVVDGVVTLNNTATGQTPDASDNSTKLATTAWVRGFVTPYTLPIASDTTLGGIKVGSGLSIDGSGVLSLVGGGSAAVRALKQFTAFANQTVFTVPGGYVPGLLDVFVNGVLITPNAVTATNGSTFTLADATLAGDLVDVFVYNPIYQGFISSSDQVPEGTTNLYFTPERAQASISGTAGRISYSAGQIDLATSGVTSGNYGSGSAIPTITVDAYGRITSISTTAVQIVTNLAGLTDVTLTSPSDTQLLRYDAATSKWVNWTSNYATISYVDTAVANLVDASPSTLDTLNELAAALGDDANFATTITTSIATKVSQTRTLTINGTTYDLSADRTWTLATDNIYAADGTLSANRTLTLSTYYLDIAGTTTTRFFSNGRVGIKTTTDAGFDLDVAGTGRFTGTLSVPVGTNGVRVGSGATGSGTYPTVFGYNASANSTSVAIGGASVGGTTGNANTVIGVQASSTDRGIAIGYVASTTAPLAIAIGNQTIAGYTNSVALGQGSTTTAQNQFMIGSSSYNLNPYIYGNTRGTGTAIFGGTSIDASAVLQADSTAKGFLPPRMTEAQRTAISSAATGLIVYQTDGTEGLYIKLASGWKALVVV